MKVKFITATPDAEKLIATIARVSSDNQDNPEYEKLLSYLIKHQHWSPFEHAFATFEITTSRVIAAQILRHRSFTFQEFSQRYSKAKAAIEYSNARRQDTKNRQNSIDDMSQEDKDWFTMQQARVYIDAYDVYEQALDRGIAKEVARMVLPLNTQTTIYMSGTLRSWIHYINLRSANGTQLEHMEIAKEIGRQFKELWPTIGNIAIDN